MERLREWREEERALREYTTGKERGIDRRRCFFVTFSGWLWGARWGWVVAKQQTTYIVSFVLAHRWYRVLSIRRWLERKGRALVETGFALLFPRLFQLQQALSERRVDGLKGYFLSGSCQGTLPLSLVVMTSLVSASCSGLRLPCSMWVAPSMAHMLYVILEVSFLAMKF